MDTWPLREYVSKKPSKRKKLARTFARLKSGAYTVRVSQTAIGEAVATIMRDFDEDEWEEVVGRVMRAVAMVADPSTCLPPPGPAAIEMARRILDGAPRMATTDALIVAQALVDPESQKLITRDTLIADSGWLERLEREMREDGRRTKRLKFESHV